MEQKNTFHEFCFKLCALIKTLGQEQLFPGEQAKRCKFGGMRCDEFLSALGLSSTSTLLLSPTNAALE